MNPLLFVALALGAEPSPRADALDLLLLNREKPARLELRVDVVGKSVPAVWDDTFAKLHAYFDRNADGTLNQTEAARLPTPFAVRQVLWGQVMSSPGAGPAFEAWDLNSDGKVSQEELADYYRRAGLGGVVVGVGKSPAADAFTAAIVKAIDANKDGSTDEAEWKKAAEMLAKLDTNDDEVIGASELMEKATYPGAGGAVLFAPPSVGKKVAQGYEALPLIPLPLRTADTHWQTVVAARREHEKRAPVDMTSVRGDKPVVTWAVALDGKTSPALRHTTDDQRMILHTDPGKLTEQFVAARKRWTAEFVEFDTTADGVLDAKELTAPKAVQFQQLLAPADRDGNGVLSKAELDGWLDLQEQIARGSVLLTLLDQGHGLFEVLDADHDGRLGTRDLRSAWDRLKAAGCVADGKFDRSKLPRHVLACVSHGTPQMPLGKPARPGPAWFQAMDRNGDGDVSPREFTGTSEVFAELDTDKDGLLSAGEAAKAKK